MHDGVPCLVSFLLPAESVCEGGREGQGQMLCLLSTAKWSITKLPSPAAFLLQTKGKGSREASLIILPWVFAQPSLTAVMRNKPQGPLITAPLCTTAPVAPMVGQAMEVWSRQGLRCCVSYAGGDANSYLHCFSWVPPWLPIHPMQHFLQIQSALWKWSISSTGHAVKPGRAGGRRRWRERRADNREPLHCVAAHVVWAGNVANVSFYHQNVWLHYCVTSQSQKRRLDEAGRTLCKPPGPTPCSSKAT